MNILITGGAGYIGSHVVKLFGEQTTHNLFVIDNLSTGNRNSVLSGRLIECDLADVDYLNYLFLEYSFDVVMHFAASVDVNTSHLMPIQYYKNNIVNTVNLVELCLKHHVGSFIFSSTAAVYGNPIEQSVLIDEMNETSPISPYGKSKLICEQILQDVAKVNDHFKFGILRYFNVAGASMDGRIGQVTPEATRLIKVAAQCAIGKRTKVRVFGTDYETIDGTCIRDYIHVEDIANAHLKVLLYMQKTKKSATFNCGYGKGYSVLEVIQAMRRVSGHAIPVETAPRRHGDVVSLVSNSNYLIQNTGWMPQHANLDSICKSAFLWEKKIAALESIA